MLTQPSRIIGRFCLVGMLFTLAAGIFAAAGGKHGRILDMTYPYSDETIYWPTAEPFHLTRAFQGVTDGGWWYAANNYSAAEHGGTHVDAPIHFAKDGRTIGQVPLTEWIGPAVKVDVTAECARNRDYMLSVADLRAWEKKYRRIPPHAWVIMYTGIGTHFYPDRKAVLGTDLTGGQAVPYLSFPGFSAEAVKFLLKERDIAGIALDTPSIDAGKTADFIVHQLICGAGKLGLENIARLDQLPASGATLYAIPMLIREGTGAPARVFAVLP